MFEWFKLPCSPLRRVALGLALQGGGAHGAYTWGVLERLLEEPWLEPLAYSGTSAGAMNAVVCADGWLRGGSEGAREALAGFWFDVAQAAPPAWPLARGLQGSGWLALARVLSPYEFNPLNLDPLRAIVERRIDFARLRAAARPRLCIAATRVRDGRLRLFDNDELDADALLASACLPMLHHAIERDGEAYWDGGYSGNPVVQPLLDDSACGDVLLVLLTPLERYGVPRGAQAIAARTAELAFSAAFLREMRGIAAQRPWTRFHLIEPDAPLPELEHASKLEADRGFLERLRAAGHEATGRWLERHGEALGVRSSVDLAAVFGDVA